MSDDKDITNSSNSQENAEKTDEDGKYSLKDDERRPTFYSNAEKAVEGKRPESLTAEDRRLVELRNKFNDMYTELVRDDLKPIGRGVFGDIFDQFKGDENGAVKLLRNEESGEVIGALHHRDVGDINLVWGYEGTKKSDGFGLAKILKYHPEVVGHMQQLLDEMAVISSSPNRIKLESGRYFATVSNDFFGQPHDGWLLTMFEKETSTPTSSRMDVASNPEGKSDDTATRQNEDASIDKSSTNNPTTQESDPKTTEIDDKFSLNDNDKKLGQGFGSAATSLNQVASAFRKIKWNPGTTNVDIGGGRFDKATDYLKGQGVESMVFDPFNRDSGHNKAVAERVRDEKVDTVTCNNVLNVIDSEQSRANVILQAAKALKEGGTAYFSVYEGDKSGVGRQTKSDSWQNNRPTKDYVGEIEKYFDDVSLKNGVITARNPKLTNEKSVWDFDGRYEGNDVRFSLKEEHRKRSFEDIESGKVPINGRLNPEETDGKFKSDTHQAAVRLTWDNKKKSWLLTAFEKKNSASDNTTDTGETEINGKQNDTATLQNTVFNDKDITNSSNSQENAEKTAENGEYSLKDDERRPTFYSNAARAVENIKQNKATAEQWLAMIKKNGGLKAGEDKWMGLSTKQEKTGNQTQGTGTDALTPLQSPVSGYKIKDLIHSTQEEDLKILGINRKDTKYFLKDDFGREDIKAERLARMTLRALDEGVNPDAVTEGNGVAFSKGNGTYTFGEKRAQRGGRFYQDSNGSIDLVDIDQSVFDKMGVKKMPFRKTDGMAHHVFEQHGKELGLKDEADAVRYVTDIMTNFDHVRLGRDAGTYIFSIENGREKNRSSLNNNCSP